MDGIGQLLRARFSRFEEMKGELDNRIATYRIENPNSNEILPLLERDLLNVFIRLGSLRMTFAQMAFSITEFQRCYLKILGMLDYLEIYRSRKYGLTKASTVANCIGVITNKPGLVQDFFNAGIPVWFCRPKQPGPFPHNVLNVVEPFEPFDFLCLENADPSSPVIYDGPLDASKKHNALHLFSQSWLVFKDPFAREPLSTTLASTSRALTVSQSSTSSTAQRPHRKYTSYFLWQILSNSNFQASRPQPSQSGGQDKFAPLHSSLASFSIPAWRAALTAVDQSVFVKFRCTSYAFLDPSLFVTPTKDERKAKLIESWLRSCDAWITRITHEGSLAMNAQHWHDFLYIDFTMSTVLEVAGTSTRSAKRRQHAQDLLKTKLSSNAVVVPRCTVGEPFFWQGRSYCPGNLPPEIVVRQILWELYELNFAQEFLALDRRACTDLDSMDNHKLYGRQSLISKCFVSNTLNYAPLPNNNCGLASETIRDRLPYLRYMVQIMEAWKGTKPTIFGFAHQSRITDQRAIELENAATKYYCQQFYTYFGCAAQVPHQLFPVN